MSVYGDLFSYNKSEVINLEAIETSLIDEMASFNKLMESINVVQENVGIVLEEENVKVKLIDKFKSIIQKLKEFFNGIIATIKQKLGKSAEKEMENIKPSDLDDEESGEKTHEYYDIAEDIKKVAKANFDDEIVLMFRRFSNGSATFKHGAGDEYEHIMNSNQTVFDKYDEYLSTEEPIKSLKGSLLHIFDTNKEISKNKEEIFKKILKVGQQIGELERYVGSEKMSSEWSDYGYDMPKVAGAISRDIINLRKALSYHNKAFNIYNEVYWKNFGILKKYNVKVNGKSVEE